jgi:hypothetical protein
MAAKYTRADEMGNAFRQPKSCDPILTTKKGVSATNTLTFHSWRAMISSSFGLFLQLALSQFLFGLAWFLDPPFFLSPGNQCVLGESGHLLSPFIFQGPL